MHNKNEAQGEPLSRNDFIFSNGNFNFGMKKCSQNWWLKIDVESINLFSNKPISTLSNGNHCESVTLFQLDHFLEEKKQSHRYSVGTLYANHFFPLPLRHLKCKTETAIDLFRKIPSWPALNRQWPQKICLKLNTILWCRMMKMNHSPWPHRAV